MPNPWVDRRWHWRTGVVALVLVGLVLTGSGAGAQEYAEEGTTSYRLDTDAGRVEVAVELTISTTQTRFDEYILPLHGPVEDLAATWQGHGADIRLQDLEDWTSPMRPDT